MAKVENSIVIAASTDEIDAVALDGARLPEWYVGIEKAAPDDMYPEVGGKVELVYKAAGASFNITLTVTELVRGGHIAYKMEGMMTGTQRWTHEPQGDGSTLTTAVIDYQMPGGALGKIADKLVVERMNAKNLEQSLENLKATVEG
jgi:uncharacterized membrane protein